MASIQRRGQTWSYTVSHTADGKRKRYVKCGFRTKKEAYLAATEFENKVKQGKIPYFIQKKTYEKLLSFDNSEAIVSEAKKKIKNESDYYLFLLGLTTGIRHGEIADFILKDFDLVTKKSE